MNGLSNLVEYSIAPTDDLVRFWRSNVKVTPGRRGGEGIPSTLEHRSSSSKWRSSAILDIQNFEVCIGVRGWIYFTVPNFVPICQSTAEIWPLYDFQDGGSVVTLRSSWRGRPSFPQQCSQAPYPWGCDATRYSTIYVRSKADEMASLI